MNAQILAPSLAIVVVLAGGASGCRWESKPDVSNVVAIMPGYFQLYLVQPAGAAEEKNTITAPDGTRWRLRGEPIIDMADVELKDVAVRQGDDGSPHVLVFVRPSAAEKLREWSAKHVGESCACIIDGKVQNIEKVVQLSSGFRVRGFRTKESAVEVAERMKRGGLKQ